MRFFAKTKKNASVLAIVFGVDGICAASIKRDGDNKPAVVLKAIYPAKRPPAVDALHALEKLAKELHANRYHCYTLLGSGEYQLLSVEAPNVPDAELKTAVRWKLKDMLDYSVDAATIDVLDIPIDKNAPVRAHNMFAIAARSQLIQERQHLFSDAKIPLTVIDIPEMAQRNISALLEPEGRGVALLSFDTDGGLLTVTFGGELYLSRRIDVTRIQLQETDTDRRTSYYDKITLELQRSLDHFDRQYHFITVAKLMLAPLGDSVTDLHEYLAANLYTRVEVLDLADVLDFEKVPELKNVEMQGQFFLILGAALRLDAVVP